MNSPKKDRFSKATFAILIAFIVWGLVGLVLHPIEATSFWGVGLGAVAAVLFVLAMDIRNLGLKNGLLAFITIAVVTFGAVLLNHLRGWPFGLLTYHDILGWKILGGIAWPIPAFWVFMGNAAFLLMRPKEMRYDVKLLFSWAFDTGLTVMLAALIIEPIMTDTTAQVWAVPGAIMGTPISCFIGWFLTAFVAAFVAILLIKPWLHENVPAPRFLTFAMSGLSLLGFGAATRLTLVPVQLLCLISTAYFAWSFRKASKQLKQTVAETPRETPPAEQPPAAKESSSM